MGPVTMPLSGEVYVDTQVMIYSVEYQATYAPILQPLWQAAKITSISVVTSELTLMETLVRPIRANDLPLQGRYEDALFRAEVRFIPITHTVLREVARLRAIVPSLRTPDALHAATALIRGSDWFVTNDQGFRRIPGLPLILLDNYLVP